MRTYSASLLTVAPNPRAFPPADLPEVAVVGRSNSGKSTLINALVGQRRLARVSQRPGRTRAAVFFKVEERFLLVDLPGYGYAAAPRNEVQTWAGLIWAYLGGGRPLRGVVALFDIRRTPDELDRALVSMLHECGHGWRAVWTKADKLKKSQMRTRCRELDGSLATACPGIPFSSVTRLGREELLWWLEDRVSSSFGPPG